MNLPSCVLGAALLFLQATDSPEAALQRVRSLVAVAPLIGNEESIAGRYTSAPKELTDRIGPVTSGEDLHLFPDGTYTYCEWADIMPVTVYDKGMWRMSGLTIELTSDAEVRWGPGGGCSRLQRRYLLFQRLGLTRDAVLMDLGCALSSLVKDSRDPAFGLLVLGLLRTETYDRAKATKVRAELMKNAWRPQWFKPIH